MRAVKASQVGLAQRYTSDINPVLHPQLVQDCVGDTARPVAREHLQDVILSHDDVWEVHEPGIINGQRAEGDPLTKQVEDHLFLATAKS